MDIQTGPTSVTLSKIYYYTGTSSPNIGVRVILFRQSTVEDKLIEVGRYVTGEDGLFTLVIALDDMPTGDYEVRTYGSFTVRQYIPLGDWEVFRFVNPNDEIGAGQDADLVFGSLPVFAVSEGSGSEEITVDINKVEMTTAKFSITTISVTEGRIAGVLIKYRRDGQLEYGFYNEYKIDTKTEPTGINLEGKLELYNKPISYYDFTCQFIGGDGEFGTYDSTAVLLEDTDVPFNGIPDLDEYIEVRDLEVVNASDPESGSLNSTFAELMWEDPRELQVGNFPFTSVNGYSGDPANVEFEDGQKIASYGVFMYVTTSGIGPSNEYPVTVSGIDIGDWYFVGDYKDSQAKVRCPRNTNVSFWVGMRTERTPGTSQIEKQYYKF